MKCVQKNKDEVLCRLLDLYAPRLSLVFCNTKKKVDELVLELQNRGYFAEGSARRFKADAA